MDGALGRNEYFWSFGWAWSFGRMFHGFERWPLRGGTFFLLLLGSWILLIP